MCVIFHLVCVQLRISRCEDACACFECKNVELMIVYESINVNDDNYVCKYVCVRVAFFNLRLK